MIIDLLQFLIGFFVLFFAVGFLLSKDEDLLERIAKAVLISLSVNILIGWIFGFFGLFNVWILWISILIILGISLYYFYKKKISFKLNFDKKEVLILLLILIAIFLLIFNVHANWFFSGSYLQNPSLAEKGVYDFPYHSDEWNHLAQSRYIINEGKLPFENPYFYKIESGIDNSFDNYESGFHVFLAEYELLTGIDLLFGYKYLPALFAVLSSFVLFVFVRKFYGFKPALFSVLFFASIKSNVVILGNWFFVPSTFGVFLMFGLIYSSSIKDWFLTALLVLASILIYPPVAVFGVIGLLFVSIKKKYFYGLFSLGILVLGLIYFFKFPFLFDLVSRAIFLEGWGINFSYSDVPFNVFLVTFGIYGLINYFGRKKLEFSGLFCVLNLVTIILFLIFSFSFIMPAVRSIYFLQASLSVFAGLGIYSFSRKLNFEKYYFAILFIILIVLFANYYSVDANAKVYNLVEESILDFESSIVNRNSTAIVDPFISITTTPVFGNPVVSIISTNLGGGYRELQYDFFVADCEGKKQLFDRSLDFGEHPRFYLIFKNPTECDFMALEEKNKDYYLYSYDP